MNAKKVIRFLRECNQGFDRHTFYDQEHDTELACDNVISGRFETVRVENMGRTEMVETWVPPIPKAEGSHMPPRRNRFNARAFIPDVGTNIQIGNASWLELKCAMHFMANRRVVRIEDQALTIGYVDEADVKRSHRCDFLITFDNGKKLAVAVKPDDRVEARGLDKLLRILRSNLHGAADDIIILTDAYLTSDRAWNSQSIIRARRARNDADCLMLRDAIKDIYGSVSAFDLARLHPSVARGEIAMWCLLYEGVLKMVRPDRRLCDAPHLTVNREMLKPMPLRPSTVVLAA